MRILVLLLAFTLAACTQTKSLDNGLVAENDFHRMVELFEKRTAPKAGQIKWLHDVVKHQTGGVFTPTTEAYIADIQENYWGYPRDVTWEQIKAKWSSRFDLRYADFGHPFENGNCGWSVSYIDKHEYLGELNGGSWFRITIIGGCTPQDADRVLIRVVKLVPHKDAWLIDNFLSFRDD